MFGLMLKRTCAKVTGRLIAERDAARAGLRPGWSISVVQGKRGQWRIVLSDPDTGRPAMVSAIGKSFASPEDAKRYALEKFRNYHPGIKEVPHDG